MYRRDDRRAYSSFRVIHPLHERFLLRREQTFRKLLVARDKNDESFTRPYSASVDNNSAICSDFCGFSKSNYESIATHSSGFRAA